MADETTETTFDFLVSVKTLLGITTSDKDNVLQLIIDMTKQSVVNYCNVSEVPSALNYVVCQMICDIYHETTLRSGGSGVVTSVEEDGRSVDFAGVDEIQSIIDNRLSFMKIELNRYKKLYRV